ncbi:MAG: type II toxin-antitoxin system RelE/ParE family toxin [Planctomycetes bacterium]|nr:type II toxin-antitoxin system RelE/ParE family toxin [Planctomycetota bacterium]
MDDIILRPFGIPGKYQVYAMSGKTRCELLDFLNQPDHQNDLEKLYPILETFSQKGELKNKEKCRKLRGKIWEFKAGCLRVLWFRDEGSLIICTHGYPKKQRNTPEREIKKATKRMNQYFEAKKKNLVMIDGET